MCNIQMHCAVIDKPVSWNDPANLISCFEPDNCFNIIIAARYYRNIRFQWLKRKYRRAW